MAVRLRVALALFAALPAARSRNPIDAPNGTADPHVRFLNNTFVLFATHDFSPNSTTFRMDDWRVWTSADLVAWTLAATVRPQDTPAAPATYEQCWATDGALRNDAYYFYLSLGTTEIGVLRAPSPAGPWADVLRTPLVNASFCAALSPPTQCRDPGVFEDADGEYYLVFGAFNYYIARLNADMVSFAEPPRLLAVTNAISQNGVGVLDDKPFLHREGALYYLSWGCFYGTATSVYGPYEYRGTWIDKNLIAPAFRTNVTNPNSTAWWRDEDLNDRHGAFFVAGGQTFWSSNDRSHSPDKRNTNAYRDTILTYVHYTPDGDIKPVVIDAAGVGAYDARRLEAENFMRAEGSVTKVFDNSASRGVAVAARAGAALVFPRVAGAAGSRGLALRARGAPLDAIARAGGAACAARSAGGAEWVACAWDGIVAGDSAGDVALRIEFAAASELDAVEFVF